MEDEIQEKLEENYTFKIEVKWRDFRIYDVYCEIDKEKCFEIPIIYDIRSTTDANISNIMIKIDNEIVKLFKK